jgi:O-antigen/teichoic acid export membrane protein
VPLGLGLSACSGLLIEVLFGPNWKMAGEVLKVVAVAWMIGGIGSNVGVTLLAVGKFKDNALIQVVAAITLLPLLTVGALFFSFTGAAYAILVANMAYVGIGLVLLRRTVRYEFADFLECTWRPMLAGLAMYVAVYPLANVRDWHHGVAVLGLLQLAAIAVVGAVIYSSAIFVIWIMRGRRDAPEQLTLKLLKSVWKKLWPQREARA